MPKDEVANGVVLPLNEKGERSSTSFAKAVLAHAVAEADAAAAAAITAEKDWRYGYPAHILKTFTVAASSEQVAKDVGKRAVTKALELAEFVRDGKATPLSSLVTESAKLAEGQLKQRTVKGTGTAAGVRVPYKGKQLTGQALVSQLDEWASMGKMEAKCKDAAREMAAGDLSGLAGRQFVVIGAASELCPLEPLLRAGACVFALGTRKPEKWGRLIKLARASAGSLTFPVDNGAPDDASDEQLAAAAGLDISKDLPEAVEWLLRCTDSTKPITFGNYVYADGDLNVRATLACDVVGLALAAGRSDVSFAWLASPSLPCAIPKEAYEDSQQRIANAPFYQRMLGYEKNNEGTAYNSGINPWRQHNGLVALQGPNYALAQLLRQWRAADLAYDKGHLVSMNIAPACRTASVCKNATLATVLDGMGNFEPMEAFDADTAREVMFALLASDILKRPAYPSHPFVFICDQAFHGGTWRCPWRFESIGKSCAVTGWLNPQR
eukprot:gnl/TRDRNA2_/TRDRNA2_187972_c0_seq1.p1 gnl/TRDRNA2_/TRDRNA2_187972_c0~~gnl/TRDRNA2_/TRDRNA2_187972_c0_seq1.p1  ORF type:complete len:496 (+),score=96.87 gnl/TRDRNA2_/TRDRNA2_187972_c0_seq1:66-1553(+)